MAIIQLDDEYKIVSESLNTTLVHAELKTINSKQKGTYEKEIENTFYYNNIETALKSYVRKSLRCCNNVDDILKKLNEIDSKIESIFKK